MKINIGISGQNRQRVADELTKILADEYVLYTLTKSAHWNVEGSDFSDKHKLFDEQASQLSEMIDTVAERIRTLGFQVSAQLTSFLRVTRLAESESAETGSRAFMSELLLNHETIIKHLRGKADLFAAEYGDLGTSDFVTGLLQDHEKTAWILRTHLK